MKSEELRRIRAIISDDHLPVLRKLAITPGYPHSRWAMAGSDILNIEKEISELGEPWTARTEMQHLIDVGLVYGCTCGCRGDFDITDKGLEYLKEMDVK